MIEKRNLLGFLCLAPTYKNKGIETSLILCKFERIKPPSTGPQLTVQVFDITKKPWTFQQHVILKGHDLISLANKLWISIVSGASCLSACQCHAVCTG